MKKLIFIALLVFCVRPVANAQLDPDFTQRLDNVMDSICQKLRIKGVSAALHVQNAGTWKRTYGISETGKNVTPDMVMGIGSNTKTFTSVAILLLGEQGKLSLEDTIGTWIQHPNVKGSITIRQILNHTSGIASYTSNPNFNDSLINNFERIWEMDEIMAFIGKAEFAPGTAWNYSNSNYLVAGMVIEKVTGKKYHEAIRELILAPQRLNHTFVYPQEKFSDKIAGLWSMNFGTSNLSDGANIGYSSVAMFSLATSAGAIMSTAEDNAIFWSDLAAGKIVNEESWKQMRQMVKINATADYGLGITRLRNMNGRTAFSHGGTNIGYINENLVDSINSVSVSVLTNQDSIGNNTILVTLVKKLHLESTRMRMSGIEDANARENFFKVYPNPSAGYVRIENLTPNFQNYTLRIMDISGRVVYNAHLNESSSLIDMNGMENGLYLAHIYNRDGQLAQIQKIQIIK